MRARSLPRAALLVGLLVTLTTGGALLACGSFSEDPGDGGLAEAGPEAGLEAAVLPDGAPIPPCDVAKVDSDPAHCGRCGHSCLGGACTARACQPALMATFSARSVEGPVVDATHVVVATRADPLQRVQWCPKEGCPGGLVVAADLPTAPTSLASDGTDELVSTLGGKSAGVFRVSGNTVTAITAVDGTFQNAELVTLLGSEVYFLNSYQTGEIGIYRIAGPAAEVQLVSPVLVSDRFLALAAAPGRIFVADYSKIATCAGTSCASLTTFAPSPIARVDVTALATDGTTVFWTSDTKVLLSCPVGPTCPGATQIAGASALEGGTPISLAVRGTDLYLTTDAGKIFACTAASCASTFHLVASDAVVVGAPAADDTSVYWVGREQVDAGAGFSTFRLMRLAK